MVELIVVSIGAMIKFCAAALVVALIVAMLIASRSGSQSANGDDAGPSVTTCRPVPVGPPVV